MADRKQAAIDNLKKIVKEELYKCIRCGECRTVCPVFKETPAERYTARGKMQIAEALAEGKLEFTVYLGDLVICQPEFQLFLHAVGGCCDHAQ